MVLPTPVVAPRIAMASAAVQFSRWMRAAMRLCSTASREGVTGEYLSED